MSASTSMTSAEADVVFGYSGSTFAEVKEVAFSGPYTTLPNNPTVGLKTFLRFLNGSARNLVDKRDIRPWYPKLIHPNGICYTGVWRIDQDSPYTGYFSKGSEGLCLARLSVAGAKLRAGDRRAFGIAGKVFPTVDPEERVRPGNFVLVSNLSGSKERHVLDIESTNFPTVGWDPQAILVNRIIFRMMDSRPGWRQLFPISALGVPRGGAVVTPDVMRLPPMEGTPRIDAADFRDELRLEQYPGHSVALAIEVRKFHQKTWTRLGRIDFTEDAVSDGQDHRIHFWIPSDDPSQS
ncbi:MAG: hypothetical protein JO057_09745 [Chloroflexi bacterium]|nr:hypothetical protein [Chloroflexota bacterium]